MVKNYEGVATINYNGKDYASIDVTLENGEYLCYADINLERDMESNNDLGCDLDNEIAYYPTVLEIEKMAEIIDTQTEQDLIDYCNENGIYIGTEHTVD